MLDRLVKITIDRKIFCWDRKNLETKVLGISIYLVNIFLMKLHVNGILN